MSTARPRALDIPPEIFLEIISHVDNAGDAWSLGNTCTTFRAHYNLGTLPIANSAYQKWLESIGLTPKCNMLLLLELHRPGGMSLELRELCRKFHLEPWLKVDDSLSPIHAAFGENEARYLRSLGAQTDRVLDIMKSKLWGPFSNTRANRAVLFWYLASGIGALIDKNLLKNLTPAEKDVRDVYWSLGYIEGTSDERRQRVQFLNGLAEPFHYQASYLCFESEVFDLFRDFGSTKESFRRLYPFDYIITLGEGGYRFPTGYGIGQDAEF